jgi:precorrin-6A/cobalt-precorrin-6A reductase
MTKPHILLLAGSFEARSIAQAMSRGGLSYGAWVSEPPRGESQMPQVPTLCRFNDAEAMQDAIKGGGFDAVLDASHVFDRTATTQAFAATRELGLPYLRVERAAWDTRTHQKWRSAVDVRAANAMIGQGARVFAATGWDSLADFEGFRGEVLMLRQTRRHPRPAPYPFVDLAFGDAPFTALDEQELFKAQRIDTLICRNLGGAASRPKLDAALALDLNVILIDRPVLPPELPMVTDKAEALDWLVAL